MDERIAKSENGYFVNQFANPANPLAHETTTGPEIWDQMAGDLDAVVSGVGSGGTITGLSRYFEKVAPDVEMVVADPEGSVIAHYVETGELPNDVGSWIVEGIGEDFLPEVCDLSRCHRAYTVPDRDALLTAREVLKKEGLLCGSSSGTLIAGALRYCREQTSPKRVVTFVCDSGNKYLTKQFNDYWMIDQGFIERKREGDLRDIIGRRHDERGTVLVAPEDTLIAAHGRMKLHDVSQLPVLNDRGEVVGLVDEEDILMAVMRDEASFSDPVRTVMSRRLDTIAPDRPMEELIGIFARGHVALVVDNGTFYGLITRIDLLNHLRRKMK
jgi:cystathionine beta-synthase